MNKISDTPVKLKNIDGSSAAVNFCLFPQNPNEDGFVRRLATEPLSSERVWLDRDGEVTDQEVSGGKSGVRISVVVQKAAQPNKKPATRRVANAD